MKFSFGSLFFCNASADLLVSVVFQRSAVNQLKADMEKFQEEIILQVVSI